MEKPESIAAAFHRYLEDIHSSDDLKRLQDHLETADGREAIGALFFEQIAMPLSERQYDESVIQQLLQRTDVRLNKAINPKKRVNRTLNFSRLTIAAAFILAGISIYFIHSVLFMPADNTLTQAEFILQGHYKASLQMADGQHITLKPEKKSLLVNACGICYADGSALLANDYPDNSDRMLSIITPAGGQYTVVFADGSRVRLNAGSTLKFPAAFTRETRNVVLSGEAYFQIAKGAKDKSKNSFVVHTHGQDVRVLGTEFNVSAYREDVEIRTTLFHGAVQVLAKDSLLLYPGEQAVLTENGSLIKHTTTDTDALAWSKGYFNFSGKTATQMLHELARWYGIEIVYQGEKPNFSFKGKLRRDQTISQIIQIFAMYHISLKVTNNKLIVP